MPKVERSLESFALGGGSGAGGGGGMLDRLVCLGIEGDDLVLDAGLASDHRQTEEDAYSV